MKGAETLQSDIADQGKDCSTFASNLAPTENEQDWITFLRIITKDSDPKPTLRSVQLLRRVCRRQMSLRR